MQMSKLARALGFAYAWLLSDKIGLLLGSITGAEACALHIGQLIAIGSESIQELWWQAGQPVQDVMRQCKMMAAAVASPAKILYLQTAAHWQLY